MASRDQQPHASFSTFLMMPVNTKTCLILDFFFQVIPWQTCILWLFSRRQSSSDCISPSLWALLRFMCVNRQLFCQNHQTRAKQFASGNWEIRNIPPLYKETIEMTRAQAFSHTKLLLPPPTKKTQALPPLSHSPTALKSSCGELYCRRFTPLHNAHVRGSSRLTSG